jgi:hypothetical protein
LERKTASQDRFFVMTEHYLSYLRQCCIESCPICEKPFKVGQKVVRGSQRRIRQGRFPRCYDCWMPDSRPRPRRKEFRN